MSTKNAEPRINPVTGEILDTIPEQPLSGEVLPARVEPQEVDPLSYGSVDELIAAYQEPEPDPRQVAMWLLGAQEKTEDDAEESSISIMLRILAATGVEDILKSQEVIGAQTLIGEALTIHDVKWKKSAVAGATGIYALISAHRETTDSDVIISCGAKNVCAQLLKLKASGLLPVRASVTKASKATAAGFYPLFLEPR